MQSRGSALTRLVAQVAVLEDKVQQHEASLRTLSAPTASEWTGLATGGKALRLLAPTSPPAWGWTGPAAGSSYAQFVLVYVFLIYLFILGPSK